MQQYKKKIIKRRVYGSVFGLMVLAAWTVFYYLVLSTIVEGLDNLSFFLGAFWGLTANYVYIKFSR